MPPSSTWSANISRLLSSKSPSRINPGPVNYPAGEIWKRVVVESVFQDLLQPEEMKGKRRFIRMDEHGLGGIILYEIPQDWTIESVLGMSVVEDLFDGIGVRVSFVPLYACTSFVTGQIMNARFHNVDMVPVPSHSGFSVDSLSFTLFDSIASEDEFHHNVTPLHDAKDVLDSDDDSFTDTSLITDLEDSDTSFGSIGPLTPTKSVLTPLCIVTDEDTSFSLSPLLDSLGSTPFSLKDIGEVKNDCRPELKKDIFV
ncbi:uncharacterized protein EV420DRAFT_1523996 [Desarmillaria tabescens]|uniref:Uncharacterized protein n=1 Tax=Armillaria tabescens TaxID=1929756 RepID=A0AA39NB15_ARMTA|nr:uncharacterized protein EV420DRAFT_1523996 [Desarmillaria tabescens]KAK0462309.1 hypothetical protein EV420DRAFT_1523996 [Desarmillaria tabescens]